MFFGINNNKEFNNIPFSEYGQKEFNTTNYNGLPEIDDRLFALIEGDTFIRSTDFEGSNISHTSKALLGLLKNLEGAKIGVNGEKLNQFIKRLDHIEKTVETIESKISSHSFDSIFKESKRITKLLKAQNAVVALPGGWNKHAMLYQIEHCEDHTYNFKIYNRGAGVDRHYGEQVDNKYKYSPVLELKGIHADAVCNPYFIQSLLEFKVVPNRDESVKIDENILYQFILSKLQPKSLDFHRDPSMLVTPQRSGTCTWKCLQSMMREHFDLNDYKLLQFHIRFLVLKIFLDKKESYHSLDNESARRLLEEAAKDLSLCANKMIDANQISEDELQLSLQLTQKAIQLSTYYRNAADKTTGSQKKQVTIGKCSNNPNISSKYSAKIAQPLSHSGLGNPGGLDVPLWHSEAKPVLIGIDADAVGHWITYAKDIIENDQSPSSSCFVRAFVKECVLHLNEKANQWKGMPKERIESLAQKLDELSNVFVKAGGYKTAEDMLVSHAITMLLDKLARYLPNEETHLEGYSINQEIETISQYPSFTLTNKEDLLLLEQVKQYFSKQNEQSKGSLFGFSMYKDTGKANYAFVFSTDSKSRNPEGKYWKSWIDHESFWKMAEEKGHKRGTLSDEQKISLVFTEEVKPFSKTVSILRKQAYRARVGVVKPDNDSEELNSPYQGFMRGLYGLKNVGSKPDKKEIHFKFKRSDNEFFFNRYIFFPFHINPDPEKPFVNSAGKEIHEFSQYSVHDYLFSSLSVDKKSETDLINYPSGFKFSSLSKKMHLSKAMDLTNVQIKKRLAPLNVCHQIAQNPDCLKDPSYRNFFFSSLFQSNVWLKTVKKSPEEIKQLKAAYDRVKNYYFHLPYKEKFEAILFMQQMVACAHSQASFVLEKTERNTKLLNSLNESFSVFEELHKVCKNDDEKTILRQYQCAGFFYKETLSDEEKQLFFNTLYTSKVSEDNLALQHFFSKSLQKHGRSFLYGLKDNQKKINTLMKDLGYIESDLDWKFSGNYLKANSENQSQFVIDLVNFTISATSVGENATKQSLPLAIKNNSVVKEYFGDQPIQATFSLNGSHSQCYYVQANLRIRLEYGKVFVDKKINNNWYVFIPSKLVSEAEFEYSNNRYNPNQKGLDSIHESFKAYRNAVTKISLQAYYHFFAPINGYSESKPLQLEEKNGNGSGKVKILVQDAYSATLVMDEKEYQLGQSPFDLKWLNDAISSDYVDLLFQNNVLQKVALKPFGVEFTNEEGKFVYSKDKKWCLAEDQGLSGNNHLPSKIVLTDGKKKKVLFPFGSVIPGSFNEKDAKNKLDYNHHIEVSGSFEIDSFDFNETTSTLESKTTEGNLYLAYLFLMQREYEKAESYLAQGSSNIKPLSKKEQKILTQISSVQENHPHCVALKLKALLLLMANGDCFPRHPIHQVDPEVLLSVFCSFVEYQNHEKCFQLSSEEEKTIIQNLSQLEHKEVVQSVLHKYNSKKGNLEICSEITPFGTEKAKVVPKLEPSKDYQIDDQDPHRYSYKEIFLSNFALGIDRFNYHYYHSIAVDPKHEKFQLLKEALSYMIQQAVYNEKTDEQHYCYCCILYTVQKNPHLFKDYRKEFGGKIDSKKLESIFKEICKIASPLMENALPDFYNVSQNFKVKGAQPVESSLVKDHLIKTLQESEKTKEREKLTISTVPDYEEIVKWNEDLKQLEHILKNDQKKHGKSLSKLKKRILEEANQLPNQPIEKGKKLNERNAGNQRRVGIEDLILMVMKQDRQMLVENTSLSQDQVDEFSKQVVHYMHKLSRQQHRERLLNLLKLIDKADDPIEKSTLINDLKAQASAKRAYNASENIIYLGFEVLSDRTGESKMIRPQQIEKLKNLTDKEKLHYVAHSIMGSGKSKLILPILAFLAADGNSLPIMVVPSALLQSNREEAYSISNLCFKQQLQAFEFDRHFSNASEEGGGKDLGSLERLESLYKQLISAIVNKKYIMVSKETLLALQLKYIEMLDGDTPEEEVKVIENILQLLESKGDPIVDEADTEFDVLKELVYTLGCRSPMKFEHIHTVTSLLKTILQDEELAKIVNLREETHPNFINGNIEKYLDAVAKKAALSDAFNIAKKDQNALVSYLRGKETKIPDFVKAHPKKDELAILKHLLTDVLKLTLQKNGNEHYGKSLKHLQDTNYSRFFLAIPYVASNTPNEKSRFGSTYESIVYTYLMYLFSGVDTDIVKMWVTSLQESAESTISMDPSIPYESTAAYKELKAVAPEFDLYAVKKDEQFKKIAEQVNKKGNEKVLLDIIETHVVHKGMKEYLRKLSGNALNLVNLFTKLRGFTGTPWNHQTYHQSMETEVDNSVEEKTIEILNKRCQGKVTQVNTEGSSEELLKRLFEMKECNYHAFIDCGALLRGVSNEEAAKSLLRIISSKNPAILGVVYYNEENEIVILEKGQNKAVPLALSSLTPEQRFTYYDQKHTTGSDIKQATRAKALVTIGKGTFDRDLKQSVWRMRGLDKEQTVEFVIPENIAGLFPAKKIDIQEVIAFCQKNQDHRKKDLIFRKTIRELKAIISSHLIRNLRQTSDFTQKKVQYSHYSKELIDELPMDPWTMFGSCNVMIDATTFLENYRKEASNRINSNHGIPDSVKSAIVRELNAYTIPEASDLPDKVPSKMDASEGIEVETQVETNVNVEVEVELEREEKVYKMVPHTRAVVWNKKLRDHIYANNLISNDKQPFLIRFLLYFVSIADGMWNRFTRPSIRSLSSGLKAIANLKKYAPLFSSNINYTTNFQQDKQSQTQLLDDFQKSISQVLVRKSHSLFGPAKYEIVIGNIDDVSFFRKALRQQKADFQKLKGLRLWWRKFKNRVIERNKLCLYDLEFGVIEKGPFTPTKKELHTSKEFQELIAQVKFFNGDVSYTSQQLDALKSWMNKNGRKACKEFFESCVLPAHEEKLGLYKKSELKKFLRS